MDYGVIVDEEDVHDPENATRNPTPDLNSKQFLKPNGKENPNPDLSFYPVVR